MSGQHSGERRRLLKPIAVGVGAVVLLVGAAVATINLRSDSKTPVAVADDRSAQQRADRGERPSPSPEASQASTVPGSVEGLGSTSAQPTASKSPTPTKSRTPSKTATTTAPAGVADSGTCKVSYYADGAKTANGESFNPNGLTAAHKTLKFGTMVRVTNLANGKSVDVRINDRGPFVAGRCLDLARGAFLKVATESAGVINAKYEVLK